MEEINRFFFGDILLNNFFVTTTYKSEDDNELSNNYDVYDYLSGEPATLEQYIFSNEEREKYAKIYKSIPDFQGILFSLLLIWQWRVKQEMKL